MCQFFYYLIDERKDIYNHIHIKLTLLQNYKSSEVYNYEIEKVDGVKSKKNKRIEK